mgnify:CR=1 FL=1
MDLDALKEAVITGNAPRAKELTQQAIDEGLEAQAILGECLIPAMDEVGRKFECNEYFVPELLIGARAMKGAMELLGPLLKASGIEPRGTVAIGTVKGDLHDIGKNLVASMLEGGGYRIVDLGVDVGSDDFLKAVQNDGVDVIALSALLTTTMPAMQEVVQSLEAAGLRERVKIIIGGAPITQQFADEIGADGFADNASAAVGLVRRLSAA